MTETEAVTTLRAAGCVFAEEEAAILAAAAGDGDALAALVRRRALGEPLEQVVGFADFCGVRVTLRPGVFVPRVRSELLVRTAAARTGAVTVDLCCGSGALGLAVRRLIPQTTVYAADVDPVAVACARDNLHHDVYEGDLFDALPADLRGRVDILLANVPYVATRHIPLLPAEARDHEPHTALDGGDDGLHVFRRVVAAAPAWLAQGGMLLSEITGTQAEAAGAAVRAAGLTAGIVHDDELQATVVTGVRRPVVR